MLNFFGILDAWRAMNDMVRNALGNISAEEKTFIPEMERPKAIRIARIWAAIYAATIALAIAMGSILPLMLIGLPRLYGAWHHVMTGLLQHGGLADNVTDHRLNSRTVLMNPVSRFIYWNMNYHVEHHMFPMVPYHALPRLHEMIKHDLPRPNPSILDGYREMIPAFLRQLRNEDYFLKRELPADRQALPAGPAQRASRCAAAHGHEPPQAGAGGTVGGERCAPSAISFERTREVEAAMSNWVEACDADDIDEEDVIRFDHDGRTLCDLSQPR